MKSVQMKCQHCPAFGYFHLETRKTKYGDEQTFLISDETNRVHDCRHLLTETELQKVYCPSCEIYYKKNSVCGHLIALGYDEKAPPTKLAFWAEQKMKEQKKKPEPEKTPDQTLPESKYSLFIE